MTDAVDTIVCALDDGWRYHPKHVEQFPDINKLFTVASSWIYIGIMVVSYKEMANTRCLISQKSAGIKMCTVHAVYLKAKIQTHTHNIKYLLLYN
jgi:hypothetical protein